METERVVWDAFVFNMDKRVHVCVVHVGSVQLLICVIFFPKQTLWHVFVQCVNTNYLGVGVPKHFNVHSQLSHTIG